MVNFLGKEFINSQMDLFMKDSFSIINFKEKENLQISLIPLKLLVISYLGKPMVQLKLFTQITAAIKDRLRII